MAPDGLAVDFGSIFVHGSGIYNFWITPEGALWVNMKGDSSSERVIKQVVDSDVIKVYDTGHFIKSGNSLWDLD